MWDYYFEKSHFYHLPSEGVLKEDLVLGVESGEQAGISSSLAPAQEAGGFWNRQKYWPGLMGVLGLLLLKVRAQPVVIKGNNE